MSDAVVVSLGVGVIGFITSILTLYTNYKIALLTKKTDEMRVVQDTTKSLVNHQAISNLKLYVSAVRRIADNSKNPGDIRVAEDAEKVLAALIAAQAKVDSGDEIRKEDRLKA